MEIKCAHSELVELEKLVQNPRNDNKHTKEHAELLAKVIKANGVRHPIIVSKRSGFIVAGHLRLMAAHVLGMENFPVDYQDFESEAEEYQFLSSDNNVARYAEFDQESFLANIDELQLDDFDALGLLDFELPEIETLEPQSGEDSVPEIQPDPITKRGDVWLFGNHRVMCGDGTMIDDVEKLMDGESFDLLTDPPYGIDANKMTMGKAGGKLNRGESDWDSSVPDFFQNLEFFDKKIIWGGNYFADRLGITNDWLCWHKKNDDRSFSEFELAWSNIGKNCRIKSHHWGGEKKLHVTMKPVEVMTWCLDYLGNNIFDLFLGSGSTLIACEKTNRKCYGLELDPKYVDVIVKRWQEYTGKEATLESTGETWQDLQK